MDKNQLTKLTLRDVKVVFFNDVDEGYGRSITIDCTDPKVTKQIEDWVKENNIGRNNPGQPKFKEYAPEGKEPTLQYAIKINDYTKYAGINGLDKESIGRGAIVDLVATAFPYKNATTGNKTYIGQSVSAIVVRSPALTNADSDLADLLGGIEGADGTEEEATESVIPF